MQKLKWKVICLANQFTEKVDAKAFADWKKVSSLIWTVIKSVSGREEMSSISSASEFVEKTVQSFEFSRERE